MTKEQLAKAIRLSLKENTRDTFNYLCKLWNDNYINQSWSTIK